MKFAKFLRTPILKNICKRLLLFFYEIFSFWKVKFSLTEMSHGSLKKQLNWNLMLWYTVKLTFNLLNFHSVSFPLQKLPILKSFLHQVKKTQKNFNITRWFIGVTQNMNCTFPFNRFDNIHTDIATHIIKIKH